MNNEIYCGLNNHGNTCFFNSALQNIMRCSVFINFINNLKIEHSEAYTPNGYELIEIFKDFIKEYKNNSNSAISPIKLVKYYCKINNRYRLGSQEDADEVITYFIGEIDDIIKKEIKEGRAENIIIKGDITLDKMIDYLFGIHIKTVNKCSKCHKSFSNNSIEYKISVGINSDNLNEIIDNYSKVQELSGDNQYDCENCKTKVDAIRCEKIIKTPKYLHIQLKRFENNGRRLSKIDDEVKINTKIKINDSEYKLRGSVHHMGSINGGHYIYHYNKNKSDNFEDWICLNDSGISDKNVKNDINRGYIFLYVK
jgi:ubiquitin C-terminal hydrolase